MKTNGRSHALLIEILIVTAFFILAAAFLIRIFSVARMQEKKAELQNDALVCAQNLSERLYAANDQEAYLDGAGFQYENGVWQKDAAWPGEDSGQSGYDNEDEIWQQDVARPGKDSGQPGYYYEDGIWQQDEAWLKDPGVLVQVELSEEPYEAGTLKLFTVRMIKDGELLTELPGALYREAGS